MGSYLKIKHYYHYQFFRRFAMKRFLFIALTIAILLAVLLPNTSVAWSAQKVVGQEVEWIGQDNYFVWQQTGFKDDTTYTNDDRIIRRVITKVTRDLIHDESRHISEWNNYDSLILKAHNLCQTIGQEHIVASQVNYGISHYIWQNWLPYEIREGKKLIARRAMVGLVALREQDFGKTSMSYILTTSLVCWLMGLFIFPLHLAFKRFFGILRAFVAIAAVGAVVSTFNIILFNVPNVVTVFTVLTAMLALLAFVFINPTGTNKSPKNAKIFIAISLALSLISFMLLFFH